MIKQILFLLNRFLNTYTYQYTGKLSHQFLVGTQIIVRHYILDNNMQHEPYKHACRNLKTSLVFCCRIQRDKICICFFCKLVWNHQDLLQEGLQFVSSLQQQLPVHSVGFAFQFLYKEKQDVFPIPQDIFSSCGEYFHSSVD